MMIELMEKTVQAPKRKRPVRTEPTQTELLVERIRPIVAVCEMESERQTVAQLLQLPWDDFSELLRVVRTENRAKYALGAMVYDSVRYLEALNNMRVINIYNLFNKDEEIRNDLIEHFSYEGPTPYYRYIKSIRPLEYESRGAAQFLSIVRSRFRQRYLEF